MLLISNLITIFYMSLTCSDLEEGPDADGDGVPDYRDKSPLDPNIGDQFDFFGMVIQIIHPLPNYTILHQSLFINSRRFYFSLFRDI